VNTKHPPKRLFAILTGLAAIIFAFILYPRFMGDDTFIHIGFIKDLASAKGFSFAGTKTYGTTSPLWIILGSIGTNLYNSPETVVRILSAVFTFTTVYMFYIVLTKSNLDKILIYIGIVSLCLNSFFLRWALSGMEITAAMTALLFIFYILTQSKNKYRFISGGIVFGLAMLLRPEVIGFFLIFILYYFFAFKKERKDLIISTLIAVIIFSGWLLFAYFYFETIIPNSYIYKAGESITNFKFEAAIRTIKLLIAGNLPEFVLVFVFLISLVFSFFRLKKSIFEKQNFFALIKKSDIILPILWIAGFYGYYLLKDVVVLSRYSLILVPFIILIVISLVNNSSLFQNKKIHFFFSIVYLCSILFGYGITTFKVVKPASDDFVKGFQTTYREIAEIVRRDSGERKTSVALTDVGIIGCYSGAKVYDFAGLVDASRFKYKTSYEYFIAKKPDYLILREEYSEADILPTAVSKKILFQRHLPGFGINHAEPRTVTLYKLKW
jgi:hypothetical protein